MICKEKVFTQPGVSDARERYYYMLLSRDIRHTAVTRQVRDGWPRLMPRAIVRVLPIAR